MQKIAIVGGGVSGLTLAINLCKIFKNSPQNITMFEASSRIGGRVFTKVIDSQVGKQKFYLDVGANLIDFNDSEAELDWNKLIPQKVTVNLKKFSRPFILHDNQTLRKGDYEKPRYYYKGGFNKFVTDLANQIDHKSTDIKLNSQIVKIQNEGESIKLTIKNKQSGQILQNEFDKVYFACPSITMLIIMKNSTTFSQSVNIEKYYKKVQYTKQISVAFQTSQQNHPYSSILFKNHQVLSFICSHQEKYLQNTFVAQINEEFSEKYFHQNEDKIGNLIYELLPTQIKKTVLRSLYVHKWSLSLVKMKQNNELIPQIKQLQFIGDSTAGKSRVSGSIQTVLRALPKL